MDFSELEITLVDRSASVMLAYSWVAVARVVVAVRCAAPVVFAAEEVVGVGALVFRGSHRGVAIAFARPDVFHWPIAAVADALAGELSREQGEVKVVEPTDVVVYVANAKAVVAVQHGEHRELVAEVLTGSAVTAFA